MKGRKKIILIIIAVIIAAVLIFIILNPAIFEKVNLEVLNPGFEVINESGRPAFWQGSKEGWFIDTEHSHSGRNCMRATASWNWLKQVVAVEPGKWYALKAYVKSDISVPEKDYANTIFSLECVSRIGKVLTSDYEIINAISLWQLKEMRIYVPKGTKKIRIKLAKRKGEGSVWFDDVELAEFSSESVLNHGFETLDESGKPKFWKEDSKAGWYVDKRGPYKEKICMEANTGWSYLWQDISVRGKKYYTLKAYVRSDIVILDEKDYENTFLTLECLNKNYEVIKSNDGIVNATSSWQLRKVGIAAPEDTNKIRVKLAKRKGEGSVWFDDVELAESPYYMRIEFLRKALKDKPFFIFYLSVYIILLLSLLRIILKKR